MPTPTPHHPRGFSLLEALVASLVFLVGVTGTLGALVHARNSSSQARRDMLAQAVTSDLVEQIDTWPYDDPRLASPVAAPCTNDPSDSAAALKQPSSSAFANFVACAHGGAHLTLGGKTWAGLAQDPSADAVRFPNGPKGFHDFKRYWVVREEDRAGQVMPAAQANSGIRKKIWVFVTYQEHGAPRRLVGFATKYRPGGL